MNRRALLVLSSLLLLAPPAFSEEPAAAKTYVGQVVCSGCWDEAPDRKTTPYGTEADMRCAARCEKEGIAAALAVEEGGAFRIYNLARGKLAKTSWLDLMGKRVELTGRPAGSGKSVSIAVDSVKRLPDPK